MLETLLSNRTVSVLWEALPRILSAGLTMTIPLTLVSFTLAMVLAVAVALVQYARVPVLSQLARFYIWVIRGTPLLVQLFIIFYGLPSVGIMLDAFPAAVIAFAFNEGAYCAETMRGALESVPQGQLEAGYCVGMSWWQIMRRIVLPQALRTAVPALSNSLIGMIKDTSLASNITVAELFMAGQRVAARTYIFLPIYCEVAVVLPLKAAFPLRKAIRWAMPTFSAPPMPRTARSWASFPPRCTRILYTGYTAAAPTRRCPSRYRTAARILSCTPRRKFPSTSWPSALATPNTT